MRAGAFTESADAGRGKPSAPARQGSQAMAMRPTAMSDLRGAMRIRSSTTLAGSRLARASLPLPARCAASSSSRSAVERLEALAGARDVAALAEHAPGRACRGPGAGRRGAAAAEYRAEHRGADRDRGVELALAVLRLLALDAVCEARRRRSSSDLSFAACFSRSFVTSRSRCSRSACARRARKSPSLSPGFEVSFSAFAASSSTAPFW